MLRGLCRSLRGSSEPQCVVESIDGAEQASPKTPPLCKGHWNTVSALSDEVKKPNPPPLPPIYDNHVADATAAAKVRSGESPKVMAADGDDEELTWAEPVKLDRDITREFLELDQFGKVQAEYVWVDSDYSDGRGFDLCSKCLTLDASPHSVDDLPVWAYSGPTNNDMYLVPRRIYRCPFRRGKNIIVLADTYEEPKPGSGDKHGPPSSFNSREACEAMMQRAEAIGDDPWFGIEQEYYLLDIQTNWPLGWPKQGYPGAHDAYYCSVGAHKAPGRDVVEAHYRACLYAGVKLGGINSEEAPGQWEFQVGPCSGSVAADDLWMARYILQRICEMFHVNVTFDPKPVSGWAGISCHTNYSSNETRRKPGGMQAMISQIEKLKMRHHEHMKVYGKGNERRMTGQFSTASMDDFSYGVGLRECTIRIASKCAAQDCGYYEDRRPAANMDPYIVMMMIVETTLFVDELGIPTSLTEDGRSRERRPSRREICSWDPERQASGQNSRAASKASTKMSNCGQNVDGARKPEKSSQHDLVDEILAS